MYPAGSKQEIGQNTVSKADSKYGFKKKTPIKKQVEIKDTEEEVKREEKGILQVGSHSFKECPVAYQKTEMGLISLIDLINWSEDMKTPLFDGGLDRYTAWFFSVRNIVINEQRLIEWEEHEKIRQKSEKGGKGSKNKQAAGSQHKSGKR